MENKQKKNMAYNILIQYVDIKENEVKISVFMSIITLLVFIFTNIYSNFMNIEPELIDFIQVLVGALISLIGFILAGIAIVVSLLDIRVTKKIEVVNRKEGILKPIYDSFKFSVYNIGIYIFLLIVMFFLIISNVEMLSKSLFYLMSFIYIYLFYFNLFFVISLVGNCITVHEIKNIYEEINDKELEIHKKIDEIKINFMFNKLQNFEGDKGYNYNTQLIEFIESSNYKNKELLVEYINLHNEENFPESNL